MKTRKKWRRPACTVHCPRQDHLGWQRAHVVGFSMGGMVALKLGAAAPQRLHSLTALSVTGGGWQVGRLGKSGLPARAVRSIVVREMEVLPVVSRNPRCACLRLCRIDSAFWRIGGLLPPRAISHAQPWLGCT